MPLDIPQVVDRYFAGKAVSRNELRDAFTKLGTEAKGLNAKSDDYAAFRHLEIMIFQKRDELVKSVKTEGDTNNQIIHKLLDTEAGNIFFYDIITPLYSPVVHMRTAMFHKGHSAGEDLESVMVHGRHVDSEMEGTPKPDEKHPSFNFTGGLIYCSLIFKGHSAFSTNLQSAIFNTYLNWRKKQSKEMPAVSSLAMDEDQTPDDTTDRLMPTNTESGLEDFMAQDELHEAENFWQRKLATVKIKPERKQILELTLQGMADEEIAQQLNMKIGTVGSGKFYLRQLVRSSIAEGRNAHELDETTKDRVILHGLLNLIGNGHFGTSANRS